MSPCRRLVSANSRTREAHQSMILICRRLLSHCDYDCRVQKLRSAFKTSSNLSPSFYYSAPKRLFELCPPWQTNKSLCRRSNFISHNLNSEFAFEMHLARPINDYTNAANVLSATDLEVAFVTPGWASVHSNDPVVSKGGIGSKTSKDLQNCFFCRKN